MDRFSTVQLWCKQLVEGAFTQIQSRGFFCLLQFDVLATSKIISVWVPTCNCQYTLTATFVVLPPLGDLPASTVTQISHTVTLS